MAMIRICATEGCHTKTLGKHCLEHEFIPRLAAGGRIDTRPVATLEKAAA